MLRCFAQAPYSCTWTGFSFWVSSFVLGFGFSHIFGFEFRRPSPHVGAILHTVYDEECMSSTQQTTTTTFLLGPRTSGKYRKDDPFPMGRSSSFRGLMISKLDRSIPRSNIMHVPTTTILLLAIVYLRYQTAGDCVLFVTFSFYFWIWTAAGLMTSCVSF